MYQNFKVVANTAVGRRRYLKYLLPQVLASDIVDRYDLWVNTLNKSDIAFFEAMATEYPKLNLIWQPNSCIDGIYSMADFYPFCQERNTIYIKLDDDVVWFDPNFFEEICKFRVENPDYFLVSPLVINNGICTFILQNQNLLHLNEYFTCQGYDLAFYNGYLAEQLHHWFIDNYLKTGKYSELYCGTHDIALQRFAINAVAWFGDAFKPFGGKLCGDDEEFLTVTYPARRNLKSAFHCNTIVSHFSFSAQRSHLDGTNVLKKYEEVILRSKDPKLLEIFARTTEILHEIDKSKDIIDSRELPRGYHKGNLGPTSKHKQFYKLTNKMLGLIGIPQCHRQAVSSLLVKLIRANRQYI